MMLKKFGKETIDIYFSIDDVLNEMIGLNISDQEKFNKLNFVIIKELNQVVKSNPCKRVLVGIGSIEQTEAVFVSGTGAYVSPDENLNEVDDYYTLVTSLLTALFF